MICATVNAVTAHHHHVGSIDVVTYRRQEVRRCVSPLDAAGRLLRNQASPFGRPMLARYGRAGTRAWLHRADPTIPAWALSDILTGIVIQAQPTL